MISLLILSLLVVVAVSYLSSMVGERATADAYTSKARAEQVAQAGVDSAMAILEESFRDFPDSATVWDTQQSKNKDSSYNEGTSLYLRAVGTTASVGGTSMVVADPQYTGTSTAANNSSGNNPNNPACKNFVLPLISGVPGGRAQLVTTRPTTPILPLMNLSETDPTKQNFTDLNVRRYAGDPYGVIGSPPAPTWTANTPKPSRALWVNLTNSAGLLTGRYAFWIEDESFRANVNLANSGLANADSTSASARADNAPDASTQKYPIDTTTKQPYITTPADAGLSDALTAFDFGGAAADAQSVLDARKVYPGKFLPDPLAFAHSAGGSTGASALPQAAAEGLRYLTTTQSGTLNLTRHGTQRLNLNNTVQTVDPTNTTSIQKQVDQIVQTLKFHLPNFGQRFYRLTAGTDGATLNNTTTVTQTTALKNEGIGDPALIYLYKVAANVRDYIDTDSQPTVILAGGTVAPAVAPTQPFGDENQPNPVWAIGKEAAPFLQETAIRFQPVTKKTGTDASATYNYTLAIDYYLEFWNMTDHDVYAAPRSDGKASLNGAQIRITNQQTWYGYKFNASGSSGAPDIPLKSTIGPAPATKTDDFTIDLSSGTNAAGEPVVFRAGTATVITTDPGYKDYNFTSPLYNSKGAKVTPYQSLTGHPNAQTTFLCPIVAPGTRLYGGPLENGDSGVIPDFRDSSASSSSLPQDYQTEVTFFNRYGYFDCALFGIAEGGGPLATYTDTRTSDGDYNNYSYGGSLYGNTLASEMGDPRTNNEQMIFHRFTGAAAGDLSRYYNGDHTLGYPNANYVQPVGGTFVPPGASPPGKSSAFITWPDYYTWANTTGYPNPTAATAPAVIADTPLSSIGQLGDVYDPARISTGNVPEVARGGGRTFKIGQRDDRVTYDPTGSPNATLDNIPASQTWASWRLADVFSAGPVDPAQAAGPVQDPVELPARLNINGVLRDNGAALRSLLSNFKFQPATVDPSTGTSEPLFHTPPNLAGAPLALLPTDPSGLSKLTAQMASRLTTAPSASNVPWGPFFERGELGELEPAGGSPIFGKNVASSFIKSTDLMGANVDMDHTFDRGREELVRRLSEMICTRGDTFTVYVVGQAMTQHDATSAIKINSTHRMRVTFRLVPKIKDANTGAYTDFHPAYITVADGDPTITKAKDYDPNATAPTTLVNTTNSRFAKPDRYDVQVLEVNTL